MLVTTSLNGLVQLSPLGSWKGSRIGQLRSTRMTVYSAQSTCWPVLPKRGDEASILANHLKQCYTVPENIFSTTTEQAEFIHQTREASNRRIPYTTPGLRRSAAGTLKPYI